MAVQTITYDDKQYLNQNSDIADVNKCNDTDLNEIKSVVNNNATELTNITGQILWTNPNPTSNFSAQPITLNNNNYDMYEVIYYGSVTGTQVFSSGKIPKGLNIFLQQSYYSSGSLINRTREINYTSDTTLTVQNALRNGTTETNACIPIYIIGYKTGLFN